MGSDERHLRNDITIHGYPDFSPKCLADAVVRGAEPSIAAPKTYEDGLREAFEAACLIFCADCRYGLEKNGFFGHCDGSANEWDACWPLRRAAQEKGIKLEERQ